MDQCMPPSTPAARAACWLTPWRVGTLAVLALSCLVYAPAMTGLPVSDDHWLLDGTGIGGGTRLRDCFTQPFLHHYFRPLVSVSFFVERRLWGSTPFYYHQTNVLLHALTVAVLMRVLLLAFRDRRAALLGGLLFAVQPVQAGAVAWIGGRTDAMAALFVALFAWALVAAARSSAPACSRTHVAGCAAFLLALLTKEQVVLTIALVPLAYRCFGRGEAPARWRAGLRATAPYLVTSVLFVATWLWFYPDPLQPAPRPLADHVDLCGRTIAYYALLLVAPTRALLNTFTLGSMASPHGLWASVGFSAAVAATVVFARSVRRSPEAAWFLALAILSLVAVLNILPVPSLVVEQWRAGVAGLGVAALGGVLVSRLWRPLVCAAAAAYVAWGIGLSWAMAAEYLNDITTYQAYVRDDPYATVFRRNLAAAYAVTGRYREAAQTLEVAMDQLYGTPRWRTPDVAARELRSGGPVVRRVQEHIGFELPAYRVMGDLFGQLGMARRYAGDKAGALDALKAGAAIDTTNDFVNLGLGLAAYEAGDYGLAGQRLARAIAANPRNPIPHRALGEALAAQGRWADAAGELAIARRLRPWHAHSYVRLAEAQMRSGDLAGAEATIHGAAAKSVLRTSVDDADLARLSGLVSRLRAGDSGALPPARRWVPEEPGVAPRPGG